MQNPNTDHLYNIKLNIDTHKRGFIVINKPNKSDNEKYETQLMFTNKANQILYTTFLEDQNVYHNNALLFIKNNLNG